MTTIDTTTTASGLAFCNGRHIARTSTGRIWVGFNNGASQLEFWYSDDDGATFTQNGSATINAVSANGGFSFFIDIDDHAHVAFQGSGSMRYSRMANIGTATSWASAFGSFAVDNTYDTQPDIVAFRDGASWIAAITASNGGGGQSVYVLTAVDSTPVISYSIFAFNGNYASIDFNHTGDGKTIADSAPHLYVTGVYTGSLRYRKFTYSGGSYTAGTTIVLDGSATKGAAHSNAFDGTRSVIAYAEGDAVFIAERDASDTTTTLRTPTALSDGTITNVSVSYDANQDIHLWAVGTTSDDLKRCVYDRSTDTWGYWQIVFTGTVGVDSLTLARGYHGDLIDAVFLDGASSPYNVTAVSVDVTDPLPIVIGTSTASTATAYSNQRKIDRCQNGVLWAIYNDGGVLKPHYSENDGATWTANTGGYLDTAPENYTTNCSFFIDADDYAHIVYKHGYHGSIEYRRGTPNAGRTAWTWSAARNVWTVSTLANYPDVVAHREGTGWKVHIVWSDNDTVTFGDTVRYGRLNITSGGVFSQDSPWQNPIAAYYGNAVHKYPSIDFHHTGDGKTVAGSTPHLYAGWSAGATGSGKGIRFKKATYSGGAWTWGTEREIDPDHYPSNTTQWMNCLFDGTRVIIGGCSSATISELFLHDRDAADTATTFRIIATGVTGADYILGGAMSYDAAGNVFMVGGSSASALGYYKWNRDSNTVDPRVEIEREVEDYPFTSLKRGHSNGRIEFTYTDGTADPFYVKYGSVSVVIPASFVKIVGDVKAKVRDAAGTAPFVRLADGLRL
jgi:hypothetical protein